MSAGEQEESLRRVFLIDNHRGGAKLPMFGGGKDRTKLRLRQARQKTWPKLLRKVDMPISGQEFARAIHKSLFQHTPQFHLGRELPGQHAHGEHTPGLTPCCPRAKARVSRRSPFSISIGIWRLNIHHRAHETPRAHAAGPNVLDQVGTDSRSGRKPNSKRLIWNSLGRADCFHLITW